MSDAAPDPAHGLAEATALLRASGHEDKALDVERALAALSDDGPADSLRRIREWCEAYPTQVFPDQDLKRADAVLKEAGISMSAMHGQWARHIVEGIARIAGADPHRATFGG